MNGGDRKEPLDGPIRGVCVPGWGSVLVLVALLAAGCAQSRAPEGGPVPETPPSVVSVDPDTFEVREPFEGPVRVEFERRLSERPTGGTLRDAVVVSPRSGEVEVSHSGQSLEISMEGGFREETVYQISILPVLQDRYQNRLEGPYEYFFSTGPEFEPNLLAGSLLDRLTLEEVAGARVDARRLPDGPVHSAVSDSTGIFTFSYLPAGDYSVVAYEDLNRNREADFTDPQDSVAVDLMRGDTLILTDLALLAPDTTAASVTGASFLDSIAVEVRFDDHLDPDDPLEGVVATLAREDGASAPEVIEVIHRWEWDEREAARREEEAEDPPEVDPDAVDPDAVDPEEALPGEPGPAEDQPFLPDQALVLVLASALEPAQSYEVEITGVRNISGVPGGGGEGTVDVPETEPDPGDGPPGGGPPPDGEPPDGDPPDGSRPHGDPLHGAGEVRPGPPG